MASLDSTERAKVALAAGESLIVTTTGQCTVQGLSGAPATTTTLTANSQTFGPYGVSAVLLVTNVSGRTEYSANNATFTLNRTEKASFDALVSAYGIQPATWYNGSINSVATSHIVADGDLSTATDQVPKWWLIVLNAASDVEAAQRLLDGGPNVLTVLPGQTIQPPVQDYLGASAVLTTAHVVCISTATAVPADYTGGAYILSDAAAETLANALTNLAKFEWSSGLGCTSFRATASAVYSTNYSALMVAAGV